MQTFRSAGLVWLALALALAGCGGSGTDPKDSGTTPGTDSGTSSGTDSGTTPGMDSGTTPGMDSGTNPGSDAGQTGPFDAGTARHFQYGASSTVLPAANGVAVSATGEVYVGRIGTLNNDAGLIVAKFRGADDGGFDDELAAVFDAFTGAGDNQRLVYQGTTLHALARSGTTPRRMIYAQKSGGTWIQEDVVTGVSIGNPAYDLAVASDGTVHVAFQTINAVLDAGQATSALVHAQRTGANAWTVTQIGMSTNADPARRTLGRTLAMALTPAGEPAIAFEGDPRQVTDGGTGYEYNVMVATRSGGVGGTFTTETATPSIIHEVAATPVPPRGMALGIAGDGTYQLMYLHYDPSMGALTSGQRTRTRSPAGTWSRGPLPELGAGDSRIGEFYTSYYPRMTTAPDGTVWAAVNQSQFLRLFRFTGSTAQQIDIPGPDVSSGMRFGQFSQIVIGADYSIHVTSREQNTNTSARRLLYTVIK